VIAPKAIVCLGGSQRKPLLKSKDPISRFRGNWYDLRNTKLLPTIIRLICCAIRPQKVKSGKICRRSWAFGLKAKKIFPDQIAKQAQTRILWRRRPAGGFELR